MINTLYLSYDGLADPLGQSQILPYLFGLSKNYKITILSFEKSENINKSYQFISNKLKENQIDWVPLKYSKRPPIISTIWDIYKLNKTVNKLIKSGVNLIHCRSYITSLVALKIKRKHNIPFIFDMRGFYADERVDGEIWDKNKLPFNKIYSFFKKKEKEFLEKAEYNISLTSNGKKEIESWKLPNQSPISVIPCCTDDNLFKKENIKNVRKDIGFDEDDFVISYVGSIGTWYMLDEMLDFFKEVRKNKPNAKFLFITKDNPQLILEKALAKNIDVNSLKIQPSLREMMPSYIGLSDFSIFFILPVFSKKASSPTKMGEIMNLGIPIICNEGVGDVDEIMNECMPELLIKEFTKNEYQRIIDLIINDYKPNEKRIIETSHNYYSLEKGVRKYKEVYQSILEGKITHDDTSPLLK
ncbi:MAG: glycosyltransferase [Crocinitomicaceae bacterium]|nr:glycosyltransferase [Crocinitomicaceae bacterium]|tara:strand:+ start:3621 stop:4862 length:1242 start_codon:yes stop_codon:yes gene_type:complete